MRKYELAAHESSSPMGLISLAVWLDDRLRERCWERSVRHSSFNLSTRPSQRLPLLCPALLNDHPAYMLQLLPLCPSFLMSPCSWGERDSLKRKDCLNQKLRGHGCFPPQRLVRCTNSALIVMDIMCTD